MKINIENPQVKYEIFDPHDAKHQNMTLNEALKGLYFVNCNGGSKPLKNMRDYTLGDITCMYSFLGTFNKKEGDRLSNLIGLTEMYVRNTQALEENGENQK